MKTTRSRKTGKATGREVEKTTEAGRQTVKVKPVPPAKGPKGYKNHVKGSRKEQVHKLYDQKGREAAKEKGLALGLKPGTLVTWFGFWTRTDTAAKSAKTAAPKGGGTVRKDWHKGHIRIEGAKS